MPRSTSTQPPITDEDTGTGAALLDMLSHVVHELRSPLTVITGYAALLGDPELSVEDLPRFVEAIARSAGDIQRQLDLLVHTEEVLRATARPTLEDCDLGALVRDLVDDRAAGLEHRPVQVELRVTAPEVADGRRMESSTFAPRPTPGPRSEGAMVLHIEDDRATAELVHHVLTLELDVDVMLATQASRGLELAQHHQPDVILLDLVVRDHDGEDVLRQLRTDPSTARVPVVIVSGGLTERRASVLLEGGADAVLAKPFRPEQLCSVVQDALDGRLATNGTASRWRLPQPEDPLDHRFLEALSVLGDDSDDDESIAVLVHSMISDAEAQMQSLQIAADLGDTDEAARRAHSLSGGIGNLGAHVVVRRCNELEVAARAGDAAAVSDHVVRVYAALVDANAALTRRFPDPSAATGRIGGG